LAGRTFADFEILDELGAGGMGVVYRALDRRLERTVALKFLQPLADLDAEARARFLREARAASALDHPNVGTIYGIVDGPGGEPCIVMAYYEGETLARRISRGPLPLREAVRIALQVADGLAAAHDKGIVHRDIKPSNVITASNGVVKVLDFGLAKFTDVDQTRTAKSVKKSEAVAATRRGHCIRRCCGAGGDGGCVLLLVFAFEQHTPRRTCHSALHHRGRFVGGRSGGRLRGSAKWPDSAARGTQRIPYIGSDR
jgi:serine/threonine protein kinase